MSLLTKPALFFDFSDALGKVPKNQNFLYDILSRHYEVKIVDEPDVLIFTHTGQRNRLYTCKKIYYSQERYPPDWGQCDAAVTSCFADHPRAYYLPYFAANRQGEEPHSPGSLFRFARRHLVSPKNQRRWVTGSIGVVKILSKKSRMRWWQNSGGG